MARFESIFHGAGEIHILDELRKFQNNDGGFGHGLEPDWRSSESSALCTSIAFQIMRDHGVSREDKMVRSPAKTKCLTFVEYCGREAF